MQKSHQRQDCRFLSNSIFSFTLLSQIAAQNGTWTTFNSSNSHLPNDVVKCFAQKFTLYQNYPNPFNSATAIAFDIAHRAHVKLHIINPRGQQVRTLFDGTVSAGNHTLFWDGHDDRGHFLPTGVYSYQLFGENFSQTRKILLVQ